MRKILILLLLSGVALGQSFSTQGQFSTTGQFNAPTLASPPTLLAPISFGMHVHNPSIIQPSFPFDGYRIWGTSCQWNTIETAAQTFNWSCIDQWIGYANTNNVDLIFTVGQLPLFLSTINPDNGNSPFPVATNGVVLTSSNNTITATVTTLQRLNPTVGDSITISGEDGSCGVTINGSYTLTSFNVGTDYPWTYTFSLGPGSTTSLGCGGSSVKLADNSITVTRCNGTGSPPNGQNGGCYSPADINIDGTGNDCEFSQATGACTGYLGFLPQLLAHLATNDPSHRFKRIEMWNEPQGAGFFNGSIAQMARMQKDAYTTIQASSRSDIILTSPAPSGGLTSPASYLALFCADPSQPGQYVQQWGFHTYNYQAGNVAPDPHDAFTIATNVKNVLAACPFAGGKPLWATEGSWGQGQWALSGPINPNSGTTVTADKPAWVFNSYFFHQCAGLGRFYWFALDQQCNSGLACTSPNQNQPAAYAYALARDLMGGASITQNCSQDGSKNWTMQLSRGNGYSSLIVFNENLSAPGTYTIPANTYVRYRDITGALHPISSTTTSVPTNYDPIILESAAPPTHITTTTLPAGIAGSVFTANLTSSCASAPCVYSERSLPSILAANHLSLNASTGVITGTPVSAFSGSVIIGIQDAAGQTDNTIFALSITSPVGLNITNGNPPNGTLNTAYLFAFTASGGVPPYSWSLSSGTLPHGTSLTTVSNQGQLSGITDTAATYTFAVQVQDTVGTVATSPTYTVVISNSTSVSQLTQSNGPACTGNGLPDTGCTAPFTGLKTSVTNTSAQTQTLDIAPQVMSTLPWKNYLYSGYNGSVRAYYQPFFPCGTHVNIGMDERTTAAIAQQAAWMVQQGVTIVNFDYYGTDATLTCEKSIVDAWNAYLTANPSVPLKLEIMLDQGALKPACPTSVNDQTACLITAMESQIDTIDSTYGQKSYYSKDGSGRPFLFYFITPSTWHDCGDFAPPCTDFTSGTGIYATVLTYVHSHYSGRVYQVINRFGSFSSLADGEYAWIQPPVYSNASPNSQKCWDDIVGGSCNWTTGVGGGTSYLNTFYAACKANPTKHCVGMLSKGFDWSNASWNMGIPKIVQQGCGNVPNLMAAKISSNGFSSSSQLESVGIVTWNDYEEGTGSEMGIDNCARPTLTLSTANSVGWLENPTDLTYFSENTIDHWDIYYQPNGTGPLFLALGGIAPSVSTQVLTGLVPSGSSTIYVNMVGKAGIVNRLTNPITFTNCGPPTFPCSSTSAATVPVTVAPFSGGTGQNTIAYDTSLNPMGVDPIVRATDSSTGGISFVETPTGNDWDNVWNTNDTMLTVVQNNRGQSIVLGFNPSTMQITTTGAQAALPNSGQLAWSRTNPCVLYSMSTANGTVYKTTFNGSPCTPASFTQTVLFTPTGACGSFIAQSVTGATLSISEGDQSLNGAWLVGSQGSNGYIWSYNLATNQCTAFSTLVTTNNVRKYDGTITTLAESPSCSYAGIHSSTVFANGLWQKWEGPCGATSTTHWWQIGTTTMFHCSVFPSGHDANAFNLDVQLNNPNWQTYDITNGSNICGNLSTLGTTWITNGTAGDLETHVSAQYSRTNCTTTACDQGFFMGATGWVNGYTGNPPVITKPGQNEIFGITFSPYQWIRFTHNFTSGLTNCASCNFRTYEGIAAFSQTGKFAAFPSDMLIGLGLDSDGIQRQDVFIVRLD